MKNALLAVALCCLASLAGASEAVWQWSIPVESVVSRETNDHPEAFLWAPPACERLRGVVVGQHNMLEEPLLEHPAFRARMEELGFAIVWVSPALAPQLRTHLGEGAHLDAMLEVLALHSGHEELASVPVVPIGHSAMASYPYHFAAWAPGRTLAAISLKGAWPTLRDENSPPWTGDDVAGVPLMLVSGEYEWADERAGFCLEFRREFPSVPFTMMADVGGGHFDLSDELVEHIALYIAKAAEHRLQPDSTLRPLDAAREGWLFDRWRQHDLPKAEPGPVAAYAGPVDEAFWAFDEEHARAVHSYRAGMHGKKPQLLGFMQEGAIVEQRADTHQQVTLQFLPREDGLTFELDGAFIGSVPEGRPERWTGLPKGSPIGHAQGGGPVRIELITGPVKRVDEKTWRIDFKNWGAMNAKRSGEAWFMAVHPGDDEYRRAVQQAMLRFPWRNTTGADQSIHFPRLGDVPAGTETVALAATASSGGPVSYYVKHGPAVVEGNELRLLPIPVGARLPMTVTVVAWQWGRSIEPKVKSAAPVERTFHVVAPGAPEGDGPRRAGSWERARAEAAAGR